MQFRRQHRRFSAFTLLEIMIAIALLAMIVGAIYASWNSILKGTRVALDAAAAAQRSRITIRTLHDSLLCACMFSANGTNNYYEFDGEKDGEDSSLGFVARLPRSFPRSGKFGDLTTRRIEFTVEPGEDGKKQLVLRQRPLIMQFDKDERQFPLVLAHNVSTFLVEYVDPQSGDWVSEWDATNQLPREIRITIGLGHLDQFSTKAQTAMMDIVAPPGMSVPRAWQTPNGGGAGINPGVNPGLNNGAPGNNGNPNGALNNGSRLPSGQSPANGFH